MAKKNIEPFDNLFDDVLKDALFENEPALNWLKKEIIIDRSTLLLSKTQLVNLVNKFLVVILVERKTYKQLENQMCDTAEKAIQSNELLRDSTKILRNHKESLENDMLGLKDFSFKKIEEITKAALSNNAKIANKAKNAKYDELKKFVFDLVKAKKYKSRRNAALSIKPQLLDFSTALSEAQAESTITGWLKDEDYCWIDGVGYYKGSKIFFCE